MLVALDIPPGIFRNGTLYQSQGRYYDADLIRFGEAGIEPIGGWIKQSKTALSGAGRQIITWSDNSNQAWTAVGTHSHLYAVTRSGSVADITPAGFTAGRANAIYGGGYGIGPYGAETYGTARTNTTAIIPASVWSLTTFGELLLGTMGGTIYEWGLSTSTPATPVTNAPTADVVIVTDERIVMALGTDADTKAVDWSDAEDRNDWTPSATNLAGGKRLQTNGSLMACERVRGGYLILTDVDAHFATFVGLPLVYQFKSLSDGCGIVSKGGVVTTPDETYWFGEECFWVYNGYVADLPCDVQDYVFGDLNRLQISKVSGWNNSLKGEAWWHYPSADSDECDRYVFFNYRKKHWGIGELDRLCGVDRGLLKNPQLVGADGYVYRHETGVLKDERRPFIQSGPVELGHGDRTMEVEDYIPDTINTGDVDLTLTVRDYPGDASASFGPFDTTAKTDLRLSGRSVAVTLTGPADADFLIGKDRFNVKAGSPR